MQCIDQDTNKHRKHSKVLLCLLNFAMKVERFILRATVFALFVSLQKVLFSSPAVTQHKLQS